MTITIKELRQKLDEFESEFNSWPDVEKYLGVFENQPVMTDFPSGGIGPAKIIPAWEHGLVILSTNDS